MAQTVIQSMQRVGEHRRMLQKITVDCVLDDGTGAFADTLIDPKFNDRILGYDIERVRIFIGATAPTNLSDLTLIDSDGFDILGGAGVDKILAAANSEFAPLFDSVVGKNPVVGPLTVKIANNIVLSATVKIYFFFGQRT